MNEQDFERISELFAQLEERLDKRFEQIDARFEQIDARFEQVDARFEVMDSKIETFKNEIITEFNHSLDIKQEELFHRLGLLRDGVADLAEREERLEERVTEDEAKHERLSLDLLIHDLDLRAHTRRRGYEVKEEEAVFGDVEPFQQFEPEFRKCLLETRKRLDDAADEIRAYCAEKGIELPLSDREAMIRLIEEMRSTAYCAEKRVALPKIDG